MHKRHHLIIYILILFTAISFGQRRGRYGGEPSDYMDELFEKNSAAAARSYLGIPSSSGLTPTDGSIMVGDGTDWQVQAKPVYDVRDYGDITTDIGASINLAVAAMTAGTVGIIQIPPGNYPSLTAVDFTDATDKHGLILQGSSGHDGTDTAGINIQHAGVGFDCTGSRNITFRNLQISGQAATTPSVGILLARQTDSGVAGKHVVENCDFMGYFVTAAIYDYGSEEVRIDKCDFYTVEPDASCIHITQSNDASLASTYQTIATGSQSTSIIRITQCNLTNAAPDGGSTTADCITLEGAADMYITGNFFQCLDRSILFVDTSSAGCSGVRFIGNRCETGVTNDYSILWSGGTSCSNWDIIGNKLSGTEYAMYTTDTRIDQIFLAGSEDADDVTEGFYLYDVRASDLSCGQTYLTVTDNFQFNTLSIWNSAALSIPALTGDDGANIIHYSTTGDFLAGNDITALGTIELGHATDTTLSRPAAGRLQIKGVEVAKGTPTVGHIPVGDGTTFTNQAKPVVDIRDYGAGTSESAADNTTYIHAAIAVMSAGDMLYIPLGAYSVTNVVFDAPSECGIIMDGGLYSTASGTTLQIGAATVRDRYRLLGLKVVSSPLDWTDDRIGIELLNVQDSYVDLRYVYGFQQGLTLHGDGEGCEWNEIHLKGINSCEQGIRLDQENSGWVNANCFFGGEIRWDSGLATYADTIGIMMDHDASYPCTGNNFYSVGMQTTAASYGITKAAVIHGEHNHWYGGYREPTGYDTGVSVTLTQAAGTATGTAVGHTLLAGDGVNIAGANQAGYNGKQVVLSAPTADTFTYTVDSTTASPATGTITVAEQKFPFQLTTNSRNNVVRITTFFTDDDFVDASGTTTNKVMAASGYEHFRVQSSILMATDAFMGINGANGRVTFPANDVVSVEDADLGVGTQTPSAELEVEKDQNAFTTILVDNNTAGTGAGANVQILSDTAQMNTYVTSGTYTPASILAADSVYLYGVGVAELGIAVTGAVPIRFFQNGSQAGEFNSSGDFETTGNIELGHATENTLSAASGVLSVEGTAVAMTGTAAATLALSDGVSGTLVLDDGATERITLVFTGGILTSRTVAASAGALQDWTD